MAEGGGKTEEEERDDDAHFELASKVLSVWRSGQQEGEDRGGRGSGTQLALVLPMVLSQLLGRKEIIFHLALTC